VMPKSALVPFWFQCHSKSCEFLLNPKSRRKWRFPVKSWMNRELVDPAFGFQPRGLSSMASPFVPGTGMRRSEPAPSETGMAPTIGSRSATTSRSAISESLLVQVRVQTEQRLPHRAIVPARQKKAGRRSG
jgi:hypothetical protein